MIFGNMALAAVFLLQACTQPAPKTNETVVAEKGFQLAQKPPMGWNSYNCFGGNVTEAEVKADADYMAEKLKQYGWEYVVVDFLWIS